VFAYVGGRSSVSRIIVNTYAYDGSGLRASQTIAGVTTYLTWSREGGLPLILSDTTNNYLYGPGDLPIEQVASGGTVTYLHHDQQGSTRMLTSSSGAVQATTTYDAYGNVSGHTGSGTTPLGYDGQYTSADTGLIYLRARVYDPATAQFLTSDPIASVTRAPYTYALDSPVNGVDTTGLCSIDPFSSGNCFEEAGNKLEGVLSEGGEKLAGIVSSAGKFVAEEAPIAAPVLDVATGIGCAASIFASCPVLLGLNTLAQEAIIAAREHYGPRLTGEELGLDETEIVTSDALGGLGELAVANSNLKALGRAALGIAVSAPQFVLDSAQAADAAEGYIPEC
jgi:RHS repeat-associated protein